MITPRDEADVVLHDLGGDGPALLLCHPTGFHGMVWAPVAAHLADVAHSWALDFRGHGDSPVPASGDLSWHGMADDVLTVVDRFGAGPIYGAGHSMGGAALVLAELARPGTWTALWCYEPILFPPFEVGPDSAAGRGHVRDPLNRGRLPRVGGNPMAATARRRTAVFPDRASARANYASKPPLSKLRPDALDAYVAYGLRDLPDGTVELKCTPDIEATVFDNGIGVDAFLRLGDVRCPTTICASGDGAPPAQVAALVAQTLPHGRLERFPQLSHFGPMEDPAAIAASLRTMLSTST